MIIAVDAMGGDNAPSAIVEGAVLAVTSHNSEIKILLVGREDEINAELKKHSYKSETISTLHAPEVIGTDEIPTQAIRRKKNSSMIVGLKAVSEGKADAFVSAGSTGALLTAATITIGRAEGIERPGLGIMLPNRSGHTFVIDCGANVDAKPQYLVQFAELGSKYISNATGLANPRVGLINIGAEQEKGNALTKEAFLLLQQAKINFIGNVEPRDLPLGAVDVAVCDAFVGNVILKYTEGLATALMGIIKDELMADPVSKFGALLAKPGFKRIKKRFDYDEVGGAPFLGLKSLVVKAHGSSNANAVHGAIRQCVLFIERER